MTLVPKGVLFSFQVSEAAILLLLRLEWLQSRDYIHIAIGDEKDYEKACCLNVEAGVKIASDALGADSAQVVGAMYDIKTGEVKWL